MELLNDMALFVEVVRARHFGQAAERLGMPPSTLSRRIALLEKTIGLRLLHRTTRRVEPTEAGQLYFERCKRIVDEARLAHEQLHEMLESPMGLLRASLPVDFATFFMAPVVAEFARRYPGIQFEFDLTPRRADLVSEPIDVAIRMGEPASPGLIARPIARLPRHLYASPGYIEKAGVPTRPDELEQHDCIRMAASGGGSSWALHHGPQSVQVTPGGRFSLNSIGMSRRLAQLDMGIVILADAMTTEDVSAGRLVRVLPAWAAGELPVYALTETRLLPAKVQRFIEFLKDHFASA